jgi:hypothetical protein
MSKKTGEKEEFELADRTHEVRMLPMIIVEKIEPMFETISMEAIASPVMNQSLAPKNKLEYRSCLPCINGSTEAATKLRNTGTRPAPNPMQTTAAMNYFHINLKDRR